MFSKKYCLWTPFVTKCSECDIRCLSYDDFIDIIDFVYNEQVSIAEENMKHFLVMGQELGIKGISGEMEADQSSPKMTFKQIKEFE